MSYNEEVPAEDVAIAMKDRQGNNILKVKMKDIQFKVNIKYTESGEWRRLHNEKLYSLYRIPNIVRVSLKD